MKNWFRLLLALFLLVTSSNSMPLNAKAQGYGIETLDGYASIGIKLDPPPPNFVDRVCVDIDGSSDMAYIIGDLYLNYTDSGIDRSHEQNSCGDLQISAMQNGTAVVYEAVFAMDTRYLVPGLHIVNITFSHSIGVWVQSYTSDIFRVLNKSDFTINVDAGYYAEKVDLSGEFRFVGKTTIEVRRAGSKVWKKAFVKQKSWSLPAQYFYKTEKYDIRLRNAGQEYLFKVYFEVNYKLQSNFPKKAAPGKRIIIQAEVIGIKKSYCRLKITGQNPTWFYASPKGKTSFIQGKFGSAGVLTCYWSDMEKSSSREFRVALDF